VPALQTGFSAAPPGLPALIAETGHSTGRFAIPRTTQEDTMLKTISAALLAISVLAAPAMAATTAKTAPAPIAKTTAKTAQAPVIKSVKAKPSVLNANARMDRHHHRFHRHSHKHMGAYKAHQFSKVSVKHVTHAAKRG
jgi:hypothetical protein